ncbi:MAG: hypothetical protein QM680_05270 [Luteolibacter sp.]
MPTTLEPYLFFNGNCEEPLNFYQSTLGAEIGAIMCYKDSPEPSAARFAAGWLR